LAAYLRLIANLLIVVPVTLILAPLQMLALKLTPGLAKKIPIFWHRFVLYIFGVKVHVHGEMNRSRPLMIVSNHVSWADILVLGSMGELCFIAKSEVKTWPGINWLSRLQGTVFIDRERKRDVGVQADSIASRLISGDAMVLFAEGTTGNGNTLLPFKSALFGAPQMALGQSGLDEIQIQPVTLAYNTLHGMPLGRYHQTLASWPGDLALTPHLLNFFLQGAFDVDVCFGETVLMREDTKRKTIAVQVEHAIRSDFARLRRQYHRS